MYGLIGNPLGHSFSADFFNNKFEREGIDEHYSLFPLENIGELLPLLASNPGLKGLNVTIPYKKQVIPFLSEISDAAKEIGAVNVIKINSDGKLSGYNTDSIGFRNSLTPLLAPHVKKALVLGTGGASLAVEYVLRNLGLEVTKVSRKKTEGVITYSEITPDVMNSHHLIVNTTPLGTWPNTDASPDIPYHLLTSKHICHDLVYNPETTEFMRRSAEFGATVKNGFEMLIGQAIAAWEIWNS